MGIDPIEANFILTLVGVAVGAVVSLIGACSKCMLKSRCVNIKTPCISCERDVLSESNEVYHDAEEKNGRI